MKPDRETVPVFVTTFGRTGMLFRCLYSLERAGFELLKVVDNTGELPPLLTLTDHLAVVFPADNQHKHHAAWKLGLVPTDRYYIVTEEDIAIDPECPDDLVERLISTLEANPSIPKLGLRIRTDVPRECEERWSASLNHERAWNLARQIAPGVLDFPVDTHFAMHRPGDVTSGMDISGARLDAPYQCIHQPWMNPVPTDEEAAYYARVGEDWNATHIGR